MRSSRFRKSITASGARGRRLGPQAAAAAALVTACAVSAPALGAARTAATGKAFTGKTAQGLPVKLGKPTKAGRPFTYQATMNCSDGTTFLDNPFVDVVTIKKGKFRSRYTSDRGATQTNVTGTIKGKKASGTVKITERYSATPNAQGIFPLDGHGTVICQSGAVRWTARSR